MKKKIVVAIKLIVLAFLLQCLSETMLAAPKEE
jgi:hypothetical protein